MNQVRFLEEAETEFLREAAYYASVQADGAERFRVAVEEAVGRSLAFPLAGQPYRSETRRVFVRGYPFFLVYRPDAEGITILAVVHGARRPGYWSSRAR